VTRVAVIGGGISGLAAAWDLTRTHGVQVTLIESATRLGGKIATEEFAGTRLDTGPDAFLARVPAAAALAREAGLGDDLVAPGTGQAWLWRAGRLRPLPTGLVLGVPTHLGALARSGVLPAGATARAAMDVVLPGSAIGPDEDIAVGALVRRRMGRRVQMGLVDPLLGGINAGHTDHLSAAVAAPQLLVAARRHPSLIRGLRMVQTTGTAGGAVVGGGPGETGAGAPVFLTVRGGLSRLVDALASGLADRGAEVVTGDGAARLERTGGAWTVTLNGGRVVTVDAVVLSVPTGPAADLLRPLSPRAADDLEGIATASVALVLLAYRVPVGTRSLGGSGFLVPRAEGRLVTAASWLGAKWPHLAAPGLLMVRASTGRVDDDRGASMDDGNLGRAVHAELAQAMDLPAGPVETRVCRWPAAFPQYEVGHLARIDRVERRLDVDTPGVVLAGAALRGVGIATCVTGGRAAAARVLNGRS